VAWGPAAVWATILFLLSRLTTIPAPLEPFTLLWDKAIHFSLYTVMGLGLAWARRRSRVRFSHLAMVGLGSLYGALDEVHQYFVPGRMAEVGDWIANTLGVVVGYTVLILLNGRNTSSKTETEPE